MGTDVGRRRMTCTRLIPLIRNVGKRHRERTAEHAARPLHRHYIDMTDALNKLLHLIAPILDL